MTEKTAMGDGRIDSGRLMQAIGAHAQSGLLFDMEEVARANGAMINAVMLGALAGAGRLPIPPETFEQAIRQDGKAVESNLRGFRAGLAAARAGAAAQGAKAAEKRARDSAPSLAALEQTIATDMPPAARDVMVEG